MPSIPLQRSNYQASQRRFRLLSCIESKDPFAISLLGCKRSKRIGSAETRTRVAGFRVLSDDQLHHRTKHNTSCVCTRGTKRVFGGWGRVFARALQASGDDQVGRMAERRPNVYDRAKDGRSSMTKRRLLFRVLAHGVSQFPQLFLQRVQLVLLAKDGAHELQFPSVQFLAI